MRHSVLIIRVDGIYLLLSGVGRLLNHLINCPFEQVFNLFCPLRINPGVFEFDRLKEQLPNTSESDSLTRELLLLDFQDKAVLWLGFAIL